MLTELQIKLQREMEGCNGERARRTGGYPKVNPVVMGMRNENRGPEG